jgi:hypothetical protein
MLVLFFSPISLFAQKASIRIAPELSGSSVLLDIRVKNFPSAQILEAFNEGFRAEVRYNIKLYKESEGFFSFLGDRLIDEVNPSFEAGWDQFEQSYYIKNSGGDSVSYKDAAIFFLNLFRLDDYLIITDLEEDHRYYVLANVHINPVKLAAPLSIIQIIRPPRRYDSAWERVPLSKKEEAGL